MKGTKMLAILVLALGLMVCLVRSSEAEPMGTAWTYQGRLLDANGPADDIYDAIFVLLDSPAGPLASTAEATTAKPATSKATVTSAEMSVSGRTVRQRSWK